MLSAMQIQQLVDPQVRPTPEQTAVIEAPLAPLLVVAGALAVILIVPMCLLSAIAGTFAYGLLQDKLPH